MNEFRVEQQPVTPANFLTSPARVCVCVLICPPVLPVSYGQRVFHTSGDTLGPHTHLTRRVRHIDGRGGRAPRGSFTRSCAGVCRLRRARLYLSQPSCTAARPSAMPKRKETEREKKKKGKERKRFEPLAGLAPLSLPLAFSILPHQLKPLFTAPVALSS